MESRSSGESLRTKEAGEPAQISPLGTRVPGVNFEPAATTAYDSTTHPSETSTQISTLELVWRVQDVSLAPCPTVTESPISVFPPFTFEMTTLSPIETR